MTDIWFGFTICFLRCLILDILCWREVLKKASTRNSLDEFWTFNIYLAISRIILFFFPFDTPFCYGDLWTVIACLNRKKIRKEVGGGEKWENLGLIPLVCISIKCKREEETYGGPPQNVFCAHVERTGRLEYGLFADLPLLVAF